jgi:hypothetical protein
MDLSCQMQLRSITTMPQQHKISSSPLVLISISPQIAARHVELLHRYDIIP